MVVPAHVGLYDVEGSAPILNGSRCGVCSAVFFPPMELGCAACGSSDLIDTHLAATGVLHSFATVHLHRGQDMEAPFTVGEVVLDGGPVVRVILVGNDGHVIGDRVVGEWVVVGVDDADVDIVEPRFGKAS